MPTSPPGLVIEPAVARGNRELRSTYRLTLVAGTWQGHGNRGTDRHRVS
jgi:hypothetical protein